MVFVQKVQLYSAVVFPEVIIIFRCNIIFRIVVRVVPESGHRSKVVFVDYDERLFLLVMLLQPYADIQHIGPLTVEFSVFECPCSCLWYLRG